MKHFKYSKKLLSIILSLSLVITSMPVYAEGRYFLAPPGGKEVIESLIKNDSDHSSALSGSFKAKDGIVWACVLGGIGAGIAFVGAGTAGVVCALIMAGILVESPFVAFYIIQVCMIPFIVSALAAAKYGIIGKTTYKKMIEAGFPHIEAQNQAIALSTINYKNKEFKNLIKQYNVLKMNIVTSRGAGITGEVLLTLEKELSKIQEKITTYLMVKGIPPKAAYAFINLAVSDSLTSDFVYLSIMTHERVEAYVRKFLYKIFPIMPKKIANKNIINKIPHFIGMLSIFPIAGLVIRISLKILNMGGRLLIRSIKYLLNSTIIRLIKPLYYKLEIYKAKERKAIAEFATLSLILDLDRDAYPLLSKLTEEVIREVDEEFNELKLSDLTDCSKTCIKFLLLEERLKKDSISREFISKFQNHTIPAFRACENISRDYSIGKIGLRIKIINEESFNFVMRLFNYLGGLNISFKDENSAEIELPSPVYPISGLLFKKLHDLDFFSIGIRLDNKWDEDFMNNSIKEISFLGAGVDAQSGHIKDEKLKYIYEHYEGNRKILLEKIGEHIFKGNLKDIVNCVLSENFEGVRRVILKLCRDEAPVVRKKALQIAKKVYQNEYKKVIIEEQNQFKEYFGKETSKVLLFIGLSDRDFWGIESYQRKEVERLGERVKYKHTLMLTNNKEIVFYTRQYLGKDIEGYDLKVLMRDLEMMKIARKKDLAPRAKFINVNKIPMLLFYDKKGQSLKYFDWLKSNSTRIEQVVEAIGFALGKLHKTGIMHQDLLYNRFIYKNHMFLIRTKKGYKIHFSDFGRASDKSITDGAFRLEKNYVDGALYLELNRRRDLDLTKIREVFDKAYTKGREGIIRRQKLKIRMVGVKLKKIIQKSF